MKKLAHIYKDFDSDIITINDAIRLRNKNPEKHKFFYDLVALRYLIPVERKNGSSSFSFLTTPSNNGQGGGGKGISHELIQAILCRRPELRFRIFGKEIHLKIKSAIDEWLVRDPENSEKIIFVDCRLELDPKCEWFEKLGHQIGIEVTDTSKTGKAKIEILKRSGIFVLELKMLKDWHIPHADTPSSADIKSLQRRVEGYLSKTPSLTALTPAKVFI